MLGAKKEAALLCGAEGRLRDQIRRAVASVMVESPESWVSIDALRNQICKYYGGMIAWGATKSDLCGAVAAAFGNGQLNRDDEFIGLALRPPSKKIQAKIAAHWSRKIPKLVPLMKRGTPGHARESSRLPDMVHHEHGVYRQGRAPETHGAVVDGGDGHGGTVVRRKRFAAYLSSLEVYLRRATMPAVDRQILEYVMEGKTIRWIAKELDMGRNAVWRRILKHQIASGTPAPGSGR